MDPNPNHGPQVSEAELLRMMASAKLVNKVEEVVMQPLKFQIHGEWHVKLHPATVLSSLVQLEGLHDEVGVVSISIPGEEILLLVTPEHRRSLAKTILGDLELEPADA